MFDIDKWQEIFTSIGKHPLRTILTAFGVAWGIFMLVLLLGAGKGLHNGIAYQFEGDALNSLWIRAGRTSIPYQGLQEGRRIKLKNDDYEHLLNEYSQIEELSGKYFLGSSRPVKYGEQALAYDMQGIHPDGAAVESLIIKAGRSLNARDQKENRKVTIIGEVVRDQLFKDEDPIGKSVIVDGASYKVVGVYHDKEGERTMRRLYLPISTVQKVYSAQDRIDQLIIGAGDLSMAEMTLLEEATRSALQQRKKISPKDRRAIRIFNMANEYQSFVSLMFVINSIIWMVGIFSMIAGVIGVSNIMLIIVKDRTKEIGIRKAIGATPGSIVAMIFQESIFITAVAGYIGLALGIGVLALLKSVETEFFRNPEVNFGVVLAATIVLVLAGVLAGLLPAMQAARINPVQAIKSE